MDKKEKWQQALAQSHTKLETLLDSLTEEQWQAKVHGDDQEWTVKDLVSHLVDSEAGMSIHIHKIRKGKETIPADFDLNQWNAGTRERVGPISLAELRQNMGKVRQRLLEGLETLQDDEWALTGRHPLGGIITIEQYYETIADHEAEHTEQIRQAVT